MGYAASGVSWVYHSVYGLVFFALEPETVSTYGPLLVAVFTALLGKGVDVWLKLRDEKRQKEKE